MLDSVFVLLGGLTLAAAGGEAFVRGVVGVARWARVPAGIVAVTIAAFATSSPELSVSVNAALAGTPQIGLGDAVGSNVVNLGFILGLALMWGGLQVPRETVRRDFPIALAAPLLTAAVVSDGVVSRLDGAIMLMAFAIWVFFVVRDARRARSAATEVLGEPRHSLTVVFSVGGLFMLVLAGRLIVSGASDIGLALGMRPFVIGATMVAVGTSVPELATTIIARWRGHEEIGLGTVLGSNVFNGLLIVGTTAVIHPIEVEGRAVLTALGFGVGLVAVVFPNREGNISRVRGLLLLAGYVAFVVTQLVMQSL